MSGRYLRLADPPGLLVVICAACIAKGEASTNPGEAWLTSRVPGLGTRCEECGRDGSLPACDQCHELCERLLRSESRRDQEWCCLCRDRGACSECYERIPQFPRRMDEEVAR